jgi:hypothetical protein
MHLWILERDTCLVSRRGLEKILRQDDLYLTRVHRYRDLLPLRRLESRASRRGVIKAL